MSGFNNDGVDKEFFAGTSIKSNFICSVGHGDPAGVFPRNPRLTFDEACKILLKTSGRRYRAWRLFGRGAGRRKRSRASFRGDGARPCRSAGADGGRGDEEAGFDFAALDRLAVTTGPGTFTGQRVGLAFMRGLRIALKKPLIGVTTLAAMAAGHGADRARRDPRCRRDEVYLSP